MQLPEVYIPSFYNAMQQGRADKRTERLNSMQDDLIINQKQMADEKRRAELAYGIAEYIDKQEDDATKAELYAEAIPQLSKLFPDMQLPAIYSKQAISSIKAKTSPYIPTEFKSAGETMYEIKGSQITPVGGSGSGKGIKTRTHTYSDASGATWQVDVPEQVDMFGNRHIGNQVFVQGMDRGVPVKDYEAWLQTQMPPDQFQQYKSTRVDIPTASGAPSGKRVPAPVPNASGNIAGRTNQGFAISEGEVPQPPQQGAPQIPAQIPTNQPRGYLNPDGSLKKRSSPLPTPEIDYSGSEQPPVAMQPPSAPQGLPIPAMGANALMGDSMMPEGANRFAMLQPFGSEPVNRLGGSQGIEGIEQAYTSGSRMTGAPRQGAQPPKLTKEDLMIRAGQGDQNAVAQLQRMAEVERSIKGQKVPDKVFGAYQQSMADMESIRYILSEMRKYRVMLQKGDINLNAFSQFAGAVLSPWDLQSDTYDNTSNFRRSLIAQANALLQENKGVQTDGDAKRAMGELASGTTNFGNKEMKSALDTNIRNLNRVYTTLQRSINDYKKRYPAIGEL